LIRNWSSVPGTTAEIWVASKSVQPNMATTRQAVATSLRASHSPLDMPPGQADDSFLTTDDLAAAFFMEFQFQQDGKNSDDFHYK
jgi:hypothetical protein